MVKKVFKTDEEHLFEARMVNWGLYLRHGGTPKLGYPSWAEIMSEYWAEQGVGRIAPCELDALHIENIVSTINIIGKDGIGMGELYAFILKLEYIEGGRPVEANAKFVRDKFKVRCGERTYYYHYAKAKSAVAAFAGEIK